MINPQRLTKAKSLTTATQLCRASDSIQCSQLTILLRNTTMCGLGCKMRLKPWSPQEGLYKTIFFLLIIRNHVIGLEALEPCAKSLLGFPLMFWRGFQVGCVLNSLGTPRLSNPVRRGFRKASATEDSFLLGHSHVERFWLRLFWLSFCYRSEVLYSSYRIFPVKLQCGLSGAQAIT